MKRPPKGVAVRKLSVTAHAKINIGWRVGDLRPDGFHRVSGVMQTLELSDHLTIELTDSDVEADTVIEVADTQIGLSITGPYASTDLASEDNLIFKAARLLAEYGPSENVAVSLDKQIPVGAGLGGGSADAAAALVGLSTVWRHRLAGPGLTQAASQLGSDVTPILIGGLLAVSGRGEVVRALKGTHTYEVILGVSDKQLGAGAVYQRLDEIGRSASDLWHHNDLQAAAVELLPELATSLQAMSDAGADVVFVSGSGPTVAGIVSDPQRSQAVAAAARDHFHEVIVTRPSSTGVRMTLGSRRP